MPRPGAALGYEYAVRAPTDLAEAYALTSTPKEFERALRAPREAGCPAAPLDGSRFVAGMTAGGDDELARLRVERRCRGFPGPCVNATRGGCRVGGTRMLRGIACVMGPRGGGIAIGDHR